MEYSVIIAGFGGQGVLMMGELLAHSGMLEGLNVTWMPSYGVEMRGGTANCTVMLSDEEIGAPLTGSPSAVIAMSGPALKKFAPRLKRQGLLLVNSSIVDGFDNFEAGAGGEMLVPALELARESGSEKMANVIMLGAFVACSGLMEIEQAARSVESFLPPEKKKLTGTIVEALYRGCQYIKQQPR